MNPIRNQTLVRWGFSGFGRWRKEIDGAIFFYMWLDQLKKALDGAFSLAFISENILKIWYNRGAVIRLVNLSSDRKQGPFV